MKDGGGEAAGDPNAPEATTVEKVKGRRSKGTKREGARQRVRGNNKVVQQNQQVNDEAENNAAREIPNQVENSPKKDNDLVESLELVS